MKLALPLLLICWLLPLVWLVAVNHYDERKLA